MQQINQNQQQNNFGLGKLHPKEAGLIYMIRNLYRFGVVEVVTADGLPKQFRKVEYTQIVPDGVPVQNPMDNINATLNYMKDLTDLI